MVIILQKIDKSIELVFVLATLKKFEKFLRFTFVTRKSLAIETREILGLTSLFIKSISSPQVKRCFLTFNI